jgi:signal transduction histidine kinase
MAPGEGGAHESTLKRSIVAVGLAGTAMLGFSLFWNSNHVRENTLEEARIQARVAYAEDIVYRRWNTMHGGVYVRTTDKTPADAYLADHPERDAVTARGTALTLVNPTAMSRQAHGGAADLVGVHGHISSLRPSRAENAADAWERAGLLAFLRGEPEYSSLTTIAGAEYLRLMRPLVTEERCLQCHARQGYRPGDVQGGVSVAVPMLPLRAIAEQQLFNLAAGHFLLWLVGLAGLLLGGRALLRSEAARSEAEGAIRTYAARLEESNRLKDLFTDIMRHDLMNPTGVVACYADFILERATDEKIRDFGGKIKRSANRLEQMIRSASQFSRLQDLEQIACERLDLGALVQESIRDLEDACGEAGVAVSYRPRGEFPVQANPMIGDVFTNLLANALKYAREGRRVDVDIRGDAAAWVVSVKDFGAGIPDADKGRVFGRFERIHKEGVQGSGLGLAIAHLLVELHGGRIWVEDNPAGGAVFNVAVPKDGPRRQDEDAAGSARPGRALGRWKPAVPRSAGGARVGVS